MSDEAAKVVLDAALHGVGWMRDGKRIDPRDVYLDPRDARIAALTERLAAIDPVRDAEMLRMFARDTGTLHPRWRSRFIDLADRLAALTPEDRSAWERCHIGSCKRHKDCMYMPCRAALTPEDR